MRPTGIPCGRPLLGLDVGGTRVRGVVTRGGELTARRAAVWPDGLGAGDELAFLAAFARRLVDDAGPVDAAGLALAALTTEDGEVAAWPNRPAWKGLPVRRFLEAELGVALAVAEDANAAALAEWTLGGGRGFRDGLYVTVGTGIGAGLVLDGRLVRGRRGWVGELGHLTVEPEGEPCGCGRRGCLQTVASGRALDGLAREWGLPDGTAVTAAAAAGEFWAVVAVDRAARWLGLALANVAYFLDLEAVVVGGGLGAAGTGGLWWERLEDELRRRLAAAGRKVELKVAALGEDAGLWGAVLAAGEVAAEAPLWTLETVV